MQRRLSFAVLAFAALTACTKTEKQQQAATPPPPPPTRLTVADSGINTPESALWDREGDQYLVSNINGTPLAKDNNGFISRISPDGKVTELRWIAAGTKGVTLNAPK